MNLQVSDVEGGCVPQRVLGRRLWLGIGAIGLAISTVAAVISASALVLSANGC